MLLWLAWLYVAGERRRIGYLTGSEDVNISGILFWIFVSLDIHVGFHYACMIENLKGRMGEETKKPCAQARLWKQWSMRKSNENLVSIALEYLDDRLFTG